MRGAGGPVALAAALALAACGGARETEPAPTYDGPPIPWDFVPFPEVVAPADDPPSDAKAELGDLLFYDPILGRDGEVACATCHSEIWGMSDGLRVSIGVDGEGPTGPGRTGPNETTRNALTLWNVAFRGALFGDGRSPTLELQALEPMKHPNEMDQPAATGAARIAEVPAYVTLFRKAFPGEADAVTAANVAKALATFQRTLVTDHAPYDQYVGGDAGAMAPEELRGMQAFADAGCPACHAPPLFESARFVKRIGGDDEGRFAVTHDEADRGAFRVPTLRNLRDTGPYFHDGSVTDFEHAVRDELRREVEAGRGRDLDAGAFDDLVSFLYSSLMDKANDPARPKQVPSGLPVPPDGFRIPR